MWKSEKYIWLGNILYLNKEFELKLHSDQN
jgi:hypothetical protein